jgi:anti-anti-sigma factor
MRTQQPLLKAEVDQSILVLTILRRQIEGEEMVQELKDELLASVTRSGVARVVLDLQNTLYVSSVAFWPLLALRKHLQEQNGRLILCGLTGGVHDVFTTTRMVSDDGSSAPFEMAADCAAAVTRLREEEEKQ